MNNFFSLVYVYIYINRCNYFEEEEVDLNEWVTSWLQHLLSREMKFEDIVRLWGKYFKIMILNNNDIITIILVAINAKLPIPILL